MGTSLIGCGGERVLALRVMSKMKARKIGRDFMREILREKFNIIKIGS